MRFLAGFLVLIENKYIKQKSIHRMEQQDNGGYFQLPNTQNSNQLDETIDSQEKSMQVQLSQTAKRTLASLNAFYQSSSSWAVLGDKRLESHPLPEYLYTDNIANQVIKENFQFANSSKLQSYTKTHAQKYPNDIVMLTKDEIKILEGKISQLNTNGTLQNLTQEELKKIVKECLVEEEAQKKQMQERYPIVLIQPHNIKLRLHLFDHQLTDSDSENDKIYDLWTMDCSEYLRQIFQNTKKQVKIIINNKENGILAQYIKYIEQYSKFYLKYINQEQVPADLSKNKIIGCLQDGVDNSQFIYNGRKNIYGFNALQKIFVNLNPFLLQSEYQTKNQFQALLKTVICVTIFHQLNHYIIRSLGFKLINDESFMANGKKKIASIIESLNINSNKKFIYRNNNIDRELAQLIISSESNIKKLLSQVSKLNIQEQLQPIETLAFQFLSHEQVGQILSTQFFKNCRKKLDELRKQKITIQALKKVRKNKESFSEQSSNGSIFNYYKLIEMLVTNYHKHLQEELEQISNKYEKQDLQKVLKQCLRNNLQPYQFDFLQNILPKIQIKVFEKPSNEQIKLKIQKIKFSFPQTDAFEKFEECLFANQKNTINEYKKIKQKMILKTKIQSILLQQGDYVEQIAMKNSGNIVNNVSKLLTLKKRSQRLSILLQKCQLYLSIYDLLPLPFNNQDKPEAGWMIERRIFSKLQMKSYIGLKDYQYIQKLQDEQQQQQAHKNYRNNFGTSVKSAKGQEPRCFIGRTTSQNGIGVPAPTISGCIPRQKTSK